jgi:hypothetical protein
MYKTVAEVRTILEKVLNSTQYTGVFDDPPTDQPKEKQQVHIISTASSPPPPYIQKITEPNKFTDHEPLIEDMPMFIPDLFTEEKIMELGNVSNLPKEHKCICSRSEVFIPDATPQIEGLTAIMSKEWIEEAESSSSIIQIYRDFRILLCTIGDAAPQGVFYDQKVGVNVMSKTLVDHIAPDEPLTFSCKHLKWIDGQMVKSQGILCVMSLKMGCNKVFLDFHIFDILEVEEFVLIGQPIEPLVNPNRDKQSSRLRLAKIESRLAYFVLAIPLRKLDRSKT